MTEDHGFHWPDWLITVWNAVMYKWPAHPDEGIRYPLRPRLVLRAWRSFRGGTP